MTVRTYDAKEVVLTLDGIPILGYADGTFISLEREEETYTKVVGADGVVSRAKTNNRSGTLTLTLKQTSPSNEDLSDFLKQDELSNNGVFSVLIKDSISGTRLFSSTGWVQGLPTIEYAKEISDREWAIDLANIEFDISGNPAIGGAE